MTDYNTDHYLQEVSMSTLLDWEMKHECVLRRTLGKTGGVMTIGYCWDPRTGKTTTIIVDINFHHRQKA